MPKESTWAAMGKVWMILIVVGVVATGVAIWAAKSPAKPTKTTDEEILDLLKEVP